MRVNLLPEELRYRQAKEIPWLNIVLIICVLILALICGTCIILSMMNYELKTKQISVDLERRWLEQEQRALDNLRKQYRDLEDVYARLDMITSLSDEEINSQIFQDLFTIIPTDVWLNMVEIYGSAASLSGYAAEQQVISDYLWQLNQGNMQGQITQLDMYSLLPLIEFTLEVRWDYASKTQ